MSDLLAVKEVLARDTVLDFPGPHGGTEVLVLPRQVHVYVDGRLVFRVKQVASLILSDWRVDKPRKVAPRKPSTPEQKAAKRERARVLRLQRKASASIAS
jgi:hypothetical protein